jgi:GxxExxY protein
MSIAVDLTGEVIGAAIEVHRELGPGLLESAYSTCLAHVLKERGIPFESPKPMPVVFRGIRIDAGYQLDFLVDRRVVVELKAIEEVHPVHRAQILTYLRLSGCRVGLLINFDVEVLHRGVERFSL